MIVSDTSPLVSLARIDMLELLRELYGEIVIPEAVFREVVEDGVGEPGAREVKEAGWIEARRVENADLVRALGQELDAGEAEAIALALEADAELLLMDERLGREVAQHFGLECVGILGVLTEAKAKGLLGAVRPILDRLTEQEGFRISAALYDGVVKEVGE